MTMFSIEVEGLQKRFGKKVVLDGIDLKVRTGSVFALLGSNGAGKTTLIHILSTLVAPDAGSVRVAGHDVLTNPDDGRRSISLTGQFAAVDEALTGEENLRMIGRLSGLSRSESRNRAHELLQQFDLVESSRRKVKTYSGGMRRRLDLAISLVVRRPVLFLDEPTTGLDTHSRRALWDIILQLAAQGITIFLTTQYLEEADQLADMIAVIANGHVVACGTTEELKSRIGGDVVELRSEDDEIIREIPTGGTVRELKRALDDLVLEAPEGASVNIRKPTLDDVFITLTTTAREVSP